MSTCCERTRSCSPHARGGGGRRRPGVGEAGLALVVVTAILVDEADRYCYHGDTGLVLLVLLLLLGLAGVSAVGSLLVLRRVTRALLVGATVAELVTIAGL